jgi:hypothetical protein
MPILYNGCIYEGLSTEAKPAFRIDGGRNGQIFKELDTGKVYQLKHGEWQPTKTGTEFTSATKSGKIITDSDGFYSVVFGIPIIGDNYTIQLTCEDKPGNIYNIAGFGTERCNGIFTWNGSDVFSETPIYSNGEVQLRFIGSGESWELFGLEGTPPHQLVRVQYYINHGGDPDDGTWEISQGVEPVGTITLSNNVKIPITYISNITENGFDIMTRDTNTGQSYGNVTVSWLATRDYDPIQPSGKDVIIGGGSGGGNIISEKINNNNSSNQKI